VTSGDHGNPHPDGTGCPAAGSGLLPLILALIAKPLEPRGTDVRPQHQHRIGLLEILFRQLHEQAIAAAPAPAIALDAADESLAVVIDLDKGAIASVYSVGFRLS
jgi:hypothetical protein